MKTTLVKIGGKVVVSPAQWPIFELIGTDMVEADERKLAEKQRPKHEPEAKKASYSTSHKQAHNDMKKTKTKDHTSSTQPGSSSWKSDAESAK